MYCEVGFLDKVILILEDVKKFCEIEIDFIWMEEKLKVLNVFVFMFCEGF